MVINRSNALAKGIQKYFGPILVWGGFFQKFGYCSLNRVVFDRFELLVLKQVEGNEIQKCSAFVWVFAYDMALSILLEVLHCWYTHTQRIALLRNNLDLHFLFQLAKFSSQR